MKPIGLFFIVLLLYGFGTEPDPVKDDFGIPYRNIDNNTFQAGEKTSYLVHYGLIDAGLAHLEIRESDKKMNGRDMLRIVGHGKSQGMVDFFFHVDDRYESYIDKKGIFPWLFIRDISEGGYKLKQTYQFFQNKRQVKTQKGKTHDVPPAVQDMLSAAFYARTMDMTNLKKGDIISVPSFVDDENFNLKISYGGIETIKIKSGKYKCYRFNPVIQQGRVFKAEEDLECWISADENKLPILCKAKILVGSIKVELVEYSGLSNPLARISDK